MPRVSPTRIIPLEPSFVPSASAAREAVQHLHDAFAPEVKVDADAFDQPKFVAPNNHISKVICNRCGEEIDLEWWDNAMNNAWANLHSDLSVVTPCCHGESSLNDLVYEPIAGFAQFTLWLDDGSVLNAKMLAQLEQVLKCRLKIIVGCP